MMGRYTMYVSMEISFLPVPRAAGGWQGNACGWPVSNGDGSRSLWEDADKHCPRCKLGSAISKAYPEKAQESRRVSNDTIPRSIISRAAFMVGKEKLSMSATLDMCGLQRNLVTIRLRAPFSRYSTTLWMSS
ncbi:hypothetical protein QR685DRAFT_448117 [Neurospora intermedia]|uniref:Uncharacterized protein n=1 Tax=Neurospora intermedia TaxID=5142 RepID=A0ABR3D5K0_NEUIN